MTGRAIYKGRLRVDTLEVPVKFFAAALDQAVHFRLLHAPDREPVVQQLIDKTTEQTVERAEVHKAYQLDDRRLVRLRPEELGGLEPEFSRAITVARFVDPKAIAPPFYDRPYYLGPDGDDEAYFALAEALRERNREGIARWVMRKRVYVGALRERDGYLVMISLRHAEQVIEIGSFSRPLGKELSAQEIRLARQLVGALEGEFDAASFRDDYRARVEELARRKASGQVIALRPLQKARPPSLAAALEKSVASLKAKKSA